MGNKLGFVGAILLLSFLLAGFSAAASEIDVGFALELNCLCSRLEWLIYPASIGAFVLSSLILLISKYVIGGDAGEKIVPYGWAIFVISIAMAAIMLALPVILQATTGHVLSENSICNPEVC
ncbi:MAG: hypothetical protein ABIH83_00860 [Candidatus Micrarchaeota archaeon]